MVDLIVVIVAGVLIIISVLTAFLYRQVKHYKNLYKKMSYINITEKMFEIMASHENTIDKFEELNKSILKAYNPKYSTIVIYDGYKCINKATNVEKEYIGSIEKISKQREFITKKGVSKYITISEDKTLVYTSAVERKIRSVLYSPIYHNNTYLGFWLLEDTKPSSFDNISKEELGKIKNNMAVFIENVQFQNTLEIAENTDIPTGYYNNMYMYANSRQILADYDTSCITLIFLKNISDINEKYGINVGNSLLIKIANIIKEMLPKESLYIRYSGRRLLVITPDKNSENIHPLCEKLLSRLKKEVSYVGKEKISADIQILLHTMKNQHNVEKEVQKMVSYVNQMKDINTIKII
jgi:diguanylate cyclase (GGDEF)-like protein